MTDLTTLYNLIRQFEGCKLSAYQCPAGVWTCGWGSTGNDVHPGVIWTQDYADWRMKSDADRFAKQVLDLCPELSLQPNVLCAIADFAYNLGIGRLRGSTLLKRLKAGDLPAAKKELMKWVYGGGKPLKGLVRRRTAECALF